MSYNLAEGILLKKGRWSGFIAWLEPRLAEPPFQSYYFLIEESEKEIDFRIA